MFEDITYEVILQRMLDRVPNIFDKREGSIIYDALAPAAVELQNMYIELDWILNQSFADTAQREYLVRRCAERGIIPKPATKAILQGEFNIDVPIGSRFSLDDLNYKSIEKIEDGIFRLECETAGNIGNQQLGRLIPIDYIDGLTSAELTTVLIPGENEESTEDLRKRYFDSFQLQPFGGNISDYKYKVKSLDGVGGVKVYPVWNGGGTVKLVIIDSEFNEPSPELIDAVQSAIDPIQNQGIGIGIAPIGHIVTVEGVTEEIIDVEMTITYQNGWTWEDIESYVYEVIDDYFYELASDWENQNNLVVRISQIETRILNVGGVLDIANTTINGLTQNFVLGVNSVPIRGEVIG